MKFERGKGASLVPVCFCLRSYWLRTNAVWFYSRPEDYAPYEIFFPTKEKFERGFDDSWKAFTLCCRLAFSSDLTFRVEVSEESSALILYSILSLESPANHVNVLRFREFESEIFEQSV